MKMRHDIIPTIYTYKYAHIIYLTHYISNIWVLTSTGTFLPRTVMKAMMKMPNHEIQNEPTTVRQLRRITRDALLLAVRFDSSPYRSCVGKRTKKKKKGLGNLGIWGGRLRIGGTG
jgi:hypothetical protein